jgi:hypothetical protein
VRCDTLDMQHTCILLVQHNVHKNWTLDWKV